MIPVIIPQGARTGPTETKGNTSIHPRLQESERHVEGDGETEDGGREQEDYGVCEGATGEREGQVI